MNDKPFWHSKTLWANVIAIIGIVTGAGSVVAEPETQATLLAAVNMVLRLVTKDAVAWS